MFAFASEVYSASNEANSTKILRIIFNLCVNVSPLPDERHHPVEDICLSQFKNKS